MIAKLKSTVKSVVKKYTPLSLKKSMLEIWRDGDEEFSLHAKIVFSGNDDLFRNRFVWSDLELPIRTIKERFGATKEIFLLTDRTDYPAIGGLRFISIGDLDKLGEIEMYPVICAYESDEKMLEAVRIINTRPNIFYYCPFRYLPTARYIHRNNVAKQILINDFQLNLGKFDLADFENILQALEITREIEGVYVEIGVYRGDSAHAALEYMKAAGIKRKSYFFDLFEGFTNQSSAKSSDAVWLDSHTDTSLQAVQTLLKGYDNITVSKLDIITDDLSPSITEIALCNIDVDIYEAVKSALEKVRPLIKRGGIIILEDQGHTPFLAGAFAASVEFISIHQKDFIPIQMASGQMFLIKR
jgi:hypothetical protein